MNTIAKLAVPHTASGVPGALHYQGTWDASSNRPPLSSGVGVPGGYYEVVTGGDMQLDGAGPWQAGDLVLFEGAAWSRVDGPDADRTATNHFVLAKPAVLATHDDGAPSSAAFAAVTATSATFTSLLAGAGSVQVNNPYIPLQIDTSGNGLALFMASKSGNYGLCFGYNAIGAPCGIIRMVSSDPLNFQVNNTTTAIQLQSNSSVTFYGAVICNTSLSVAGSLTAPLLALSQPATMNRWIEIESAGVPRWSLGANAASENFTSLATGAAQSLAGPVLPFASTLGVTVGMLVRGPAIPVGATVASLSPTTVTLSSASIVAVPGGVSIQFFTNTGSDFSLNSYNDDGSALGGGPVLSIARATGIASFAAPPTVGGRALLTASSLATTGITAASGGSARTLSARFADEANVLDFGADPTGGLESGAAFNAAFAASAAVFVPPGLYRIGVSVSPNLANFSLRGAGPGVSVLMNATASLPTLQLCSTNPPLQAWVSDLTLDRSVTAAPGGHGLQTDPGFTLTSGAISLFNLVSQHNQCGFALGGTAFSLADRCIAQNNQSDGFLLSNGTAGTACGWSLLNCLARCNGGNGYTISAAVLTPAAAALVANPALVALHSWFCCSSFANLGYGVALSGSASAQLCGWSLQGGSINCDGAGGVFADSYGAGNSLANIEIRAASSYGSTSAGNGIGPNRNIAAPLSGNAVTLTASNQDFSVLGGLISQPAGHGISTTAAGTTVVGTRIFNCGAALSNSYAGIIGNAGHGAILVQGVVSGGPTAGGGQQQLGISVADASLLSLVGCDLRGNLGTGCAAGNLPLAALGQNLGFTSRSSGVAPVGPQASSFVVAHGLGAVPGFVLGTPRGPLPSFWIDTLTATSFTLHFASAPGAAAAFGWMASISATG